MGDVTKIFKADDEETVTATYDEERGIFTVSVSDKAVKSFSDELNPGAAAADLMTARISNLDNPEKGSVEHNETPLQNDRFKTAVTNLITLSNFKLKTNGEKKTELEDQLNNMNKQEKDQIGEIISTTGYQQLHEEINESKEDINVKEVEESINDLNNKGSASESSTPLTTDVINFLMYVIFSPILLATSVFSTSRGGKKSRRRRKGKGKKGKSMKRRGTRGKKAKK